MVHVLLVHAEYDTLTVKKSNHICIYMIPARGARQGALAPPEAKPTFICIAVAGSAASERKKAKLFLPWFFCGPPILNVKGAHSPPQGELEGGIYLALPFPLPLAFPLPSAFSASWSTSSSQGASGPTSAPSSPHFPSSISLASS